MSRDYITGKEELEGAPALVPTQDQAALSITDLGGDTAEFAQFDLSCVSNRAFLTGDDITYSGGRGSSMIKLAGTLSMAAGAFEGIDIKLATSGAFVDAGAGVMGVKVAVTNTAHITDGNIYGGQFIAKHNSATAHMHSEACLIGLEAIGYDAATASAGVGTMIGLNTVIRSYATSAYGGGVHRGIQIVVDEATLGADEVTALCIWNMGASAIGGIRVVGAATMANMFYFDVVGGAIKAGSLKNSDNTDIKCDDYIVCSLGGSARYIPAYDTLN
jgi:hypothetical protein